MRKSLSLSRGDTGLVCAPFSKNVALFENARTHPSRISAQQLEQLERIMQQRSGTGAPTAAPKKAVDGKDDQLETYVKHKVLSPTFPRCFF